MQEPLVYELIAKIGATKIPTILKGKRSVWRVKP